MVSMRKGGRGEPLKEQRKARAGSLRLRSELGQRSRAAAGQRERRTAPGDLGDATRSEQRQPLDLSNSLGVLLLGVGLAFTVLPRIFWVNAAGPLVLCAVFSYFVWNSLWTAAYGTAKKASIIGVIFCVFVYAAAPRLLEQWRIEHMRSELAFNAKLPGIAYPSGEHYGIKWYKEYVEVRLTIASQAKEPIRDLSLTISTADTPGMLADMVQADPEPEGCVISRPRLPTLPPILMRGADGSRADLSPFMSDQMNKTNPLRDHYDILCRLISAGQSVPLLIAALPKSAGEQAVPFSELHIMGDYETTTTEGSKMISVDESVPVSELAPWR